MRLIVAVVVVALLIVLVRTVLRRRFAGPRDEPLSKVVERLRADRAFDLRRIRVRGRLRRYLLYRPPGPRSGAVPLVLAFHGGGGHAIRFAAQSGFNALAAREGFVVAYPNAVGRWNDGRPETDNGVDDIAFIEALIDELVESCNVDPARIYATGCSNGGIFTLRLACELAERIAACAPVLAAMPAAFVGACKPSRPIPIMMINGTADPLVPWNGGRIGGRGPREERMHLAGGEVISVPETVAFWVRHNGCWSDAKVERVNWCKCWDGTAVRIITHPPGPSGVELKLVRVEGGGHAWPGSPVARGPMQERLAGRKSRQIDATAAIWDFFRRHGRQSPPRHDLPFSHADAAANAASARRR